jgi:hypothetical protein
MSIAGERERAASKLPAKKMAFAETNIHLTPKRSDSFAHMGEDVVLASVKEEPIQAYSDALAVSALVTVGNAVAMMVTSNAVMNCVRHSEAIVVLLFQTDIAISPTGWASASSLSLVLLLVAIVDPCSFSCVRSGWTGCWPFACSVIANVLGVFARGFAGLEERKKKPSSQATRFISSPMDRPCVATLCPHDPDCVLSCMQAARVRCIPSVGGSDHVGGLPTIVIDQRILTYAMRCSVCMQLLFYIGLANIP